MAAPDKTPDDAGTLNFEQSLETLEGIVHSLEDGQIGLADALARYEHGVKLLKQCYQVLEQTERRIELLTRVGPAGEAITEPFTDVGGTLEEKGAARSQRRSRAPASGPSGDSPGKPSDGELPDVDVPGGLF